MEILVFRHGIAGDRADWAKTGRRDAERPLTAEGRRKTLEAAAGVARLTGADLVASSPWKRARQTALILGRALEAPVADCPALLPSAPFEDAAAWLKARGARRVVLVGHEPHLSGLATWLLTGGRRSALRLKKAQACLLTCPQPGPGKAVLVWSLPPRVLRRLA
ncbi:MAG: histidine phosphatase family protein [Elusimicrobiota bacterium]|nr:histidine phosphatase family protein [Elusimicrobiota bacterium]